ncbi:MAG: helix-turn-helix domain-containing protein [Lachnospiraceae bacterium]|nr:helix-turn-helix domain-containing protein [Lachnospiraceae bacterium]
MTDTDARERAIGGNIREARLRLRWSQEELATRCGIANTTLSAYENSKKIPNLTTVAKIAKSLGVSIEQLYYGEDASLAGSVPLDEGRSIVDSVYRLWKAGIITYYENFTAGVMIHYDQNEPVGTMLVLCRFQDVIKRLVLALNEFRDRRSMYSDPDRYVELLLSSYAMEINRELAGGKQG